MNIKHTHTQLCDHYCIDKINLFYSSFHSITLVACPFFYYYELIQVSSRREGSSKKGITEKNNVKDPFFRAPAVPLSSVYVTVIGKKFLSEGGEQSGTIHFPRKQAKKKTSGAIVDRKNAHGWKSPSKMKQSTPTVVRAADVSLSM